MVQKIKKTISSSSPKSVRAKQEGKCSFHFLFLSKNNSWTAIPISVSIQLNNKFAGTYQHSILMPLSCIKDKEHLVVIGIIIAAQSCVWISFFRVGSMITLVPMQPVIVHLRNSNILCRVIVDKEKKHKDLVQQIVRLRE